MSRSDALALAAAGRTHLDSREIKSLAMAMLLLSITSAVGAESPVIPTAPFPAQRFTALDVNSEVLWESVERIALSPSRMIAARDRSLGLITFSEYLGPQFQAGSFRNLPTFLGALRRSEDDLTKFLTSHFLETTRKELAAYDPRQYPSDELTHRVTTDLNHLLFTEVLDRAPLVADLSKPASSASGDDRAVWNRLALESAYPNEIIPSAFLSGPRSQSTIFVTVYLHPVGTTRTVLFVTAWLEGSPAMGSWDRKLLEEIEAALSERGKPR